MVLTATQIEELAAWCANAVELAAEREAARRLFFAEDDPRPVRYWPGAQDFAARDRRFLGWFMLAYRLADGRTPAELAIERLGVRQYDDVRRLLQQTRYVLAIVESVLPGSVFLRLEDERFEVRHRQWARTLQRDRVVAAHLIPVRRESWLPGPGWVELPLSLGPNMREQLGQFQLDAVEVERLLQGRGPAEPEGAPREPMALDDAVAQMTELARELERPGLALSAEQWTSFVSEHLDAVAVSAFVSEVVRRAGDEASVEQIQQLASLAVAIWNATPQPDRGGLTATELRQMGSMRAPDE